MRAWLLLALALLVLAAAHTWPLAAYLDRGIPYGYRVVPGYEVVPLVPGDHLQFLYWCWLITDNIFGPSALFSNPYEFNTALSAGIPGFANFPFSLLYLLFQPLGQAGAYNALVILSYLLAGLAAYGLAREVLDDGLAALPAGIVFALLPFRAAQVLSGHLFGFVTFLLPLCLWFLEGGLRRRSWAWGAGAGACLLAMAFMEQHLTYYTALFLGLYVHLRLLLSPADGLSPEPGWRPALMAAGGGAGLGLALALLSVRGQGAPAAEDVALAAGLYALASLVVWLALSWLAGLVTSLEPGAARRVMGRGLAPLALTALYAFYPWLQIPYLGKGLMVLALGAGLVLVLPPLWRSRRRPAWSWSWWRPILPLLAGLGLAAARQMQMKAAHYDASIAGGGRSLREVLLFTPHLADYLDPANPHLERLLFFGLVTGLLALAGLLFLALGLPRGWRQGGRATAWALVAFVFGLLAAGPTVEVMPLYRFLYHYLPFFNYPRVPGRLVVFAVLMLALLGGWALRQISSRCTLTRSARLALALVLTLVLAWDLWPPKATGICLLPPPGRVEAAIGQNLPGGPDSPRRLLGLPIWPGDSHQSSIYELTISRTRAPMINGYSPVVRRDYVAKVFRPLYPLDLGLVDRGTLAALARQKVALVSFHDDEMVYSRKVSPFPPALARQRLAASGAFIPLAQEGTVFLYRLRPGAQPDPRPGRIISPVRSLWEAEWLKRETGRLVDDRRASGWGLMFREPATPLAPLGPRRPRARGNLVQARAGRDRPGFLSFGPYKNFPPGRYRARFRLRRGPGPSPGWVEVSADKGRRSLVRVELDQARLPADGRWHDVALEFALDGLAELEFRTYYNGRADLDLDLVLVSFAGAERNFFRAQDLWRQTGDLVSDPRVPGGLAVGLRAGYHPPLYAMYGPQLTLEPGTYRARFRLARDGDDPGRGLAAELVVATDLGQILLGYRRLEARDLQGSYRDFEVPFVVKRRSEIGLRVRFAGGVSLRIAGVGVGP